MSDSDECFDILGDMEQQAKNVTNSISCEELASEYVDTEHLTPVHNKSCICLCWYKFNW